MIICNCINLGIFYNKIGLLEDSYDYFLRSIEIIKNYKS